MNTERQGIKREIHAKKDGLLLIERDGSSRYLTWLERVMWYLFGDSPSKPGEGNG